MNYRIIFYVIGWVLNFEAAFMVAGRVSPRLRYREPEVAGPGRRSRQ